jgi:hypothetical protein
MLQLLLFLWMSYLIFESFLVGGEGNGGPLLTSNLNYALGYVTWSI